MDWVLCLPKWVLILTSRKKAPNVLVTDSLSFGCAGVLYKTMIKSV